MIRRIMGYHREPLHETAPSARAADATAPARLVLVIGAHGQPQRTWADCLAERGLRCIWESDVEHLAGLQGQVLFDVVVVDVSDAGVQMVTLLARVRQLYGGRLVVIGDSRDEVDEIMALELGADDYLVTPVSARRLRARLLALLRAAPAGATGPAHQRAKHTSPQAALGGWQIDAARMRLFRGERSIALTETQAQLLQCLAHHAGRLVPRAELHEKVCPEASDIRARTIDVYVHRLRRRLLDEGVSGLRIEAVRGRGFVLHADPGGEAGAAPPSDAASPTPLPGLYLKA